MKRAVTVFATVLALLPLAAAASESFTLSIPPRFDASQEIGEVRIALTLSAPAAGAQLVVNGTTTIPLGGTQTVAGDSVAFESAANNRAVIRYRPLSNFGADFCAGGGAVAKDIPLRFEGAQNITEYRMSSFVVAAPAAECSQPSKRIADTPATITATGDGVAPALAASNLGRLPLDVILVLDKSGSIADVPPDALPGAEATKVVILKAAVNAFVANWRLIDGSGTNAEDRLGVVFFDNAAVPQTLAGADAPANFFVQRGNGDPWDAVTSSVNGLTPGGSTSIGGGINAGMAQWKADPAHDATLVVVTDGMQNTAPLIATLPNGFLSLTPVAGLPAELRKRFIPIQTIGFGTPATVDEELLRNISLDTSGRSYIGVNAATIFDDFAQTLVAILKGNTASLATKRFATLTGPGPSAALPVVVDQSARRVVFSLQWAPPLTNALLLDVFPPGSSTPATPATGDALPQASMQAFDVDKGGIGTWTVRVRRNPRAKARPAPTPYTLNVFFAEAHLDYRLSVERGVLRAQLSYDGKPLTNLPSGAIQVRVLRPRATLESVLRSAKKQARPTPGDPQTDLQRTIAALSPKDVARLTPSVGETMTLREEKRGTYSAPIGSTAMTGSYALEVVLDWTDPRTGKVHREERIEELIRKR